MAVGARQHVVVLVPGFLGFEEAHSRAAWGLGRGRSLLLARPRARFDRSASSRVASVLRAALEAHCSLPVPVVALPVTEATNLATRQRALLQHLQELDGALRGVRQFHLVGHGPGGVDAELLTASLPLKTGATWNDLDPSHLRERISSVLTIGAPHYGTQLADRPLFAGWRRPQNFDVQSLRQVAGVATSIARELLRGTRSAKTREPGLGGLLARGPARSDSFPLLLELLRQGELLRELSPHSMQALRAHNLPDPGLDARVQSIVVCAPDLTVEDGGVLRQRDGLFAALHALTGLRSLVEPPLPLTQAQKVLRHVPPERVVGHPSARLPAFDLTANDGIINAGRQLLMTRAHQAPALAAVVIADHADVLGHYDRRSPLAAEVCEQRGLLRSGANFGDDEFFHLWGLVAAHIASIAIGVAPQTTVDEEVAAQ